MTDTETRLTETITLSQARAIVKALAHKQSLLLLSPPGVGKSDTVLQAAAEAGLPCRSLLGTQIAPEDVSGVPRIVGERSVFCPPRVLLPENPEPFCLFLDELPACAPDVQKAFYSLLLERRLGEHPLPPGTWVVAAGNRVEDRALVRSLSSALINRVIMLQIRVDVGEWLRWAEAHGVRADIREYIHRKDDALMRPIPGTPQPFSTPRAWASLSRALDLADAAGVLTPEIRLSLARGKLTASDADSFCRWVERSRKTGQATVLEDVLNRSIVELELSVRATNCLESEGITTVRELVGRTEDELLEIRNFGETTLARGETQTGGTGIGTRHGCGGLNQLGEWRRGMRILSLWRTRIRFTTTWA